MGISNNPNFLNWHKYNPIYFISEYKLVGKHTY